MTPTHRSRSAIRAVGLAAAAALLVAACSSGAAATPSPTDAPASATPASSAAASAAPAAGVAVKVAQDAKLGAYLTGADGRSLYLLTSDSMGTTTCTAATGCVKAWPPFEVDSAGIVTAGDGVAGTIATITRADDGKMQVTYNGIPLYYFAKDTKAGDINGQGVKGVWFLVAPGSTAAGGTITGGVGQASAASAAPAQTGAAPSPSTAKGY